jgi:hypothetical protein
MKFLYYSFLILALAFVASCKKSSNETEQFERDTNGAIIINGDITENRTFTANEKYLLKGFVYVTTGVTLTIEPGTIIKGDKDSKGTLVVERGGRLVADGTVDKPIVFTSNQARGQRGYGDWGGVVIAGKAPVNQVDPTMEGGIRGSYGGTDNNDNSGSLRYIRIEFAGIAFQPDREINGLTLYGVGAGTRLEYIQVSYCGDDSFEWFGGTVNAKYLVAHRGWDDDFDTDFGFTGKIQYAVALRDPNYADVSASNGFESDNFNPGTPAGTLFTKPTFANVSCFLASNNANVPTTGLGSGTFGRGMHLRRNTKLNIYNSVFTGYPEGLRLDGNVTWANAQANELIMKGVVISGSPTVARAVADTPPVTTPPTPPLFTNTDVLNWFNNANNSNASIDPANLLLNVNNFSLTNPNFLPQGSSPLLSGGVNVGDSFFENTTFRGAFGTTNWTATWTNFDPQNTTY